jgi:conjugative transposon protein TcpC
MVRRSTVDRSPQPTVYSAGSDAGTGDLAQGSGGTREYAPSGWRGAGGRWLVWTFRVVVWLVLLVIGYRGVMAIVLNETPPGHARPTPSATAPSFPVGLAGAYAMQFGQVYLNASPATASQRAAELAQFLPPGTANQQPGNQQLGWNGSGTLALQSEQVAGVQVQDSNHAVVTLLARVNGGLMELGVPVFTSAGGLVVTGEPAWLPAPKPVTPPSPATVNTDSGLQSTMQRQLPAFFAAYASGDQVTLGRFLEPGVTLAGLGGAVTYSSLTAVTVPLGGSVRHIVATVVWQIPGQPATGGRTAKAAAGLEMTYALTIVRQHGTWYVRSIAPSAQSGEQP